MEGLFDGLTVADIHGDAHRNIVSLRESQDLYDDLTPNPQSWQAAIDLELATKPPTYRSPRPIIDRPFEEAVFNEAIRFPFEHWTTSRYSDGTFGVWYGADTLETGVHETVHHWRSLLLGDVGWDTREGVMIERKVYLVRCDAALLDFRSKVAAHPALIDPVDYHFTHLVGARMHHDGHPGLLSRSARCDGNIFAVFKPQVLSNPRSLCYLTYRVETGSVVVERQPGDVLLRI